MTGRHPARTRGHGPLPVICATSSLNQPIATSVTAKSCALHASTPRDYCSVSAGHRKGRCWRPSDDHVVGNSRVKRLVCTQTLTKGGSGVTLDGGDERPTRSKKSHYNPNLFVECFVEKKIAAVLITSIQHNGLLSVIGGGGGIRTFDNLFLFYYLQRHRVQIVSIVPRPIAQTHLLLSRRNPTHRFEH